MALVALCEVVFHVDNGNQVEHMWPPGALSAAEQQDVAFSSFPDSLSCELRSTSSVRDSCFSFRLRRRRPAPGAPADLYGHVFCRARTDERLRRGCEQRSIVLLSHLPLFALLEPLARLVGPAVLSYGERALRQVFEEVGRWPPLAWGERMDLPLLGGQHTLTVRLPMLTSLPASAVPAAVAAALGAHEPHQQQQQNGAAAEPAAAAAGDAAAAAAAADSDAAAPGPAAQQPAVASPAQVAAALAEELDGTGLPVCLLPQAYGQQELEASPFGDCDCYTPLRASLQHLWSLWELLLLGEQPLLVLAPSPGKPSLLVQRLVCASAANHVCTPLPTCPCCRSHPPPRLPRHCPAGACSAAVAALLSLLAPLPYSPDFRPYFTIHDPSFASLAASGAAPSPASGLPLVLGATNLYLLKAPPGWPNVLSTGYTAATLAPSSSSERLEDAAGNGGGGGGGMRHSESGASMGSSSSGSGAGSGLGSRHGSASWLGGALRRQPASPAALLSAPVDHCWLRHKPCVRPDKQLLQQLVQPQGSGGRLLGAVYAGGGLWELSLPRVPSTAPHPHHLSCAADPADKWRRLAAVNSGIIRRHFQELTKALLFPLLPYLSPAAPPPPTAAQLADPKGEFSRAERRVEAARVILRCVAPHRQLTFLSPPNSPQRLPRRPRSRRRCRRWTPPRCWSTWAAGTPSCRMR